MREEWQHTENGRYLVSNHGRVYTYDQLVRTKAKNGRWSYRKVPGRILTSNISPTGYKRIHYDGKPKLLHRVVAEIFIENSESHETVNHIDGNKLNNKIDNLEWVSNSDNVRHAIRTGLCDSRKKILCIDTGIEYRSLEAACGEYGLSKGNLSSTLRGNQKTWGGHRWAYV